MACVRSSRARRLGGGSRPCQPHQSHLPPGLQALAARLFDVSRMCLASDSVSDDIGLFSVTLCFAFQMCATVQPGPANKRGRETREVQRERERAG